MSSAVTRYESASHSHVGMVRQVNEDACLDAVQAGLWAVADGMGGYAAGDFVSSLIVDTLRAIPPEPDLPAYVQALRAGLEQANAAVRQETAQRGVGIMGSTLVLLAARGDKATCLWAGDSRLYRLREGQLEVISHDHSYVQELLDSRLLSEDEAREHPMSNIVTRAVGTQDRLELSAVDLDVRPGDSFLLCSDGLTKTVEDHELRDVLGNASPYEVVRSLVHLGLTRGAPDNITAVVVNAH
ncbi:serine/threonine protein phosphatase Stp1 [Pseudomonas chlororaphis]|uniref:Serine/threonine-protein phosphatase n=1 Tax=Pseudomonas chlororaphis subsp. aurantiaca TaxID=86192 RepID=A0AAJ0ZQH8_9PSED|nr:PP2C family serine/threonine-protein phosphatase [Pseudomonas chlororaphis]AZD22892.1 Phosphoprotein phosphatase PppA [Pseudomonas chlororaphis subsp. aurantiaca]AZD67766.1 Phosphoprotein phosphatase PppA [Pseudomonas chlororaphis subsp. aurantiaca]AZD80213.1 Phosphoprotein phosphatase PppA [Pseudomonas chlororaphis subsp. aurantiaca]MBU4636630.1 serine/threonine-protein phosphatase [Pseudomonas chlororaphis subsp. aurantiaca]QIT23719.1 serine/threonine-protein phosphatase [Pseudomonas chlo